MKRHPAVDVDTGRTVVVVQDRPVVPLSSWLADALAACGRNGRRLQVLSPSGSRITLPLRTVLDEAKARWVVEGDDGGHHDGVSGVPLVWEERDGFVPLAGTTGPSPEFSRPAAVETDEGGQLLVDLRLLHPAREGLVLGDAVEALALGLTGARPVGWGTSEPALSPWDRSALTALCRRRAPKPTWVVFTGPLGGERRFVGTQRVSRVTSGVKETITFAVGHAPGEMPPLERVARLVRDMADRGVLLSLVVKRARGRADLTWEPRWMGLPVPVGMAIGAAGVREAGLDRVLAAPVRGRVMGPSRSPSVWFPLGNGDDSGAWTEFEALMRHLRPEGAAAV
ncbi:hypothetical protein SAMN02745673_02475 [Marinactinospora thermotolerans DSM 45154]|uniref:Uncharacterized protein n=1 Tax=Marinactinospora thermotolerans DSM 45154 TaxID=1122192 RepID=A0A1T4R385_9ACTN|nr:DUF6177 family protein [Marinactinospora thermotolerans]SKA10433.1 hypothetical protein SAMN02745673_02475 [Marinactinospora thermotolerans DSM 45154]